MSAVDDIVDEAIARWAKQSFVPVTEVIDVLLDIRNTNEEKGTS